MKVCVILVLCASFTLLPSASDERCAGDGGGGLDIGGGFAHNLAVLDPATAASIDARTFFAPA